MIRAFACMGSVADLCATAVSVWVQHEQLGFAAWLAIHILLGSLVVAYRLIGGLLAANARAPDVLRIDPCRRATRVLPLGWRTTVKHEFFSN